MKGSIAVPHVPQAKMLRENQGAQMCRWPEAEGIHNQGRINGAYGQH